MSTASRYWFQDLTLLTKDYQEIIPCEGMTYAQKVNSLVRLSILAGVILSLVFTNYLYLYIPIIVMLMTYILHYFRQQELNELRNKQAKAKSENDKLTENAITKEMLEKFEDFLDTNQDLTTQPDRENPFMNPMPFDNRNRAPASQTLGRPIKKAEVDIAFDMGTYRDVNDVFDKNNGKRQFFTMPWTTYPNDQASFANWLYKTPPTCKEGNGAQCVANYYTPLNRTLITPGKGSSI